MELLEAQPQMDLYDPSWPIHTHATVCAPARIGYEEGRHSVTNSLLAGGVVVGRSTVTRSVLSTGARVGDGSLLEEVVVLPGACIGAGCKLRRVIVDSHVEVPDGTVIGHQPVATPDRSSPTSRSRCSPPMPRG
jgi:glucose-1-phosphate adenylyltransferase